MLCAETLAQLVNLHQNATSHGDLSYPKPPELTVTAYRE